MPGSGSEAAEKEMRERLSTPTNKKKQPNPGDREAGEKKGRIITDRKNEEEEQWHSMYEMKGYRCKLWQSRSFLKYLLLFGFVYFIPLSTVSIEYGFSSQQHNNTFCSGLIQQIPAADNRVKWLVESTSILSTFKWCLQQQSPDRCPFTKPRILHHSLPKPPRLAYIDFISEDKVQTS